MTTQISTQTISFNNQALITFEQNGTYYTAMKPICENIGLEWGSQYNRIKRDDVLSSVIFIMKTTGNDGKDYQMICLPIEYLNGWLFGIDVNRCKPEIRETLIKYKKECYQALHDYWFKGKAERKTTVDERTGLRNAVNMLVSKKGLIYSDAYNLVHHYMNVESIEDIPAEKLPMAVEYVHKICLEGELIIDPPKQDDDLADNLTLTSMWFALYNCLDLLGQLEQPLRAIGSHFGSTAYTHATEYCHTLQFARDVLMPKLEGVEINSWKEPHYHLALKTMRAREYPLRRGIPKR